MYANGHGPAPAHDAAGPLDPVDGATTVLRHGGRSVLRFRGSLDRTTAPALRGALLSELAHRPSVLVLDLSALEHWDSCGMGAVVTAFKTGRSQGVPLVLAGLRGRAAASYRHTNLASIIPTHPDVTSVLTGWSRAA